MDKIYQSREEERKIVDFWKRSKTFDFVKDKNREILSIDTPPPTVSGKLHIGHIFSYTHADLLARYARMINKNVFYPMGFDDNGLATEKFVAKKRGIKIEKMDRTEFSKICIEESLLAEKEFENLWSNLGLSVDWNLVYSTISPKVIKTSQFSFIDLFKKGLAIRKTEPFLYCTTCTTSVSQADLDWVERSGKFYTIEFEGQSGQPLLIATTRPELLPACQAILFHPDDNRYKALNGSFAKIPLFDRKIKVLADPDVNPEKGTGLVMCCTFGDNTDIAWYKKHKLEYFQAIGPDGRMTALCGPEFEGLQARTDGRKKIVELLDQNGLIKEVKEIVHGLNVHERCSNEIEYQIINQWFIKIVEYKEKFLEIADQIEWYPAHMKSRYIDWVSNLSWDWCISRQRFSGVPFPVWNCQNCKESFVCEPKDLPIDPRENPNFFQSCTKCNGPVLPETDVMDTWATSSLTPLIISGWPDKFDTDLFPNSLRPQAHDIIRTWAFYTIVKTHYHLGQIPWKKIAISGHVLAGKEKISKSKENASNSPEKLIEEFSADAVRFWAAGGKLGIDTLFDVAKLKNGQRTATKLWNAFKFASEHLGQINQIPEKSENMDALSCWLLTTLQETLTRYHECFEKLDYSLALDVAEKFFWKDFCDNYLELVKDLFFNPDKYTAEQIESSKFALFKAAFSILQMYAPFMPFICEKIYQELFSKAFVEPSIHLTQFDFEQNFDFFDHKRSIDLLIDIVRHVRRLKSEQSLSLKTEIQELEIFLSDSHEINKLTALETILAGISKAKNISFKHCLEPIQTMAKMDDSGLKMTIFIDQREN